MGDGHNISLSTRKMTNRNSRGWMARTARMTMGTDKHRKTIASRECEVRSVSPPTPFEGLS